MLNPPHLSLLIVDDFSTMRRIVKNLLVEIGFSHFYEASDGEKAWEMIKQHDIDIVISDWNMPNMTGLELLKKIRNHPKWQHLPFLLFTAEAKKSQFIEADKLGVDGYLIKPFTAAQLHTTIQHCLQHSTH